MISKEKMRMMEQRFCAPLFIFYAQSLCRRIWAEQHSHGGLAQRSISKRDEDTLVSPNSIHFHTILSLMTDDSFVLVGTPFPQIKKTDAFGDPKRPNPTRDLEVNITFRNTIVYITMRLERVLCCAYSLSDRREN